MVLNEKRRFTVALVERPGELLMVQRGGDGARRWAVPWYESRARRFGRLGEQLQEETGLAVQDFTGMRYFVQVLTPGEEPEEVTVGVALQVEAPEALPAHVRFMSRDQAIAALADEPDATRREPLLCYLHGECEDEMAWAYRRHADGGLDLLARLG